MTDDIDSMFSLEPQDVLSRIGYRKENVASARIRSLVDDYLDNYHDFLSPSWYYVYHPVTAVNENTITVGQETLESGVLARLCANCSRVAVFAVTIGGYLEELANNLSENGQVLQATVLDAVGSGAAETMAAEIQDEISRQAAEDGMVISRRFSPGYCDWDVAQQAQLFRLLGGKTAGITLTESMLMLPRKSVSGIIGIGLPGNDISEYNPCMTCTKRDCPGRRR